MRTSDLLKDRVERIEHMVSRVLARLEGLDEGQRGRIIPVYSFAPEPYEVVVPFGVLVTPAGDEFEAGFFDANIHSSGDTEEEAVLNLKSAILDSFDRLFSLPDEQLGTAMHRQKAVLRHHLRRT